MGKSFSNFKIPLTLVVEKLAANEEVESESKNAVANSDKVQKIVLGKRFNGQCQRRSLGQG